MQIRTELSYGNLGIIFGSNQPSWFLYLAVTLGRVGQFCVHWRGKMHNRY